VTLTLSSRTTLRHERGRVAICDQRTAAQPATAIWQTPVRTNPFGPATPNGIGSLSPADGNQFLTGLGPGVLSASDGLAASATPQCGYNGFFELVFSLIANVTWCQQFNTGFTVFSWTLPFPATNTPSPIDSLTLNLSGSSNKLQFSGAAVEVQVFGGKLGAVGCRVVANSAAQVTQSIDLLTGGCAEPLSDLSRLSGASVRVTFKRLQINCADIKWPFTNFVINNSLCRASNLPVIRVDSATLAGKLTQDKGAASKPFLVTSDITPSVESPYGDSFNLFGRISAPLADVDFRWNGTPTPEPVFNGSMVVGGIGSTASPERLGTAYRARPGIVCCTIAEQSERAIAVNGWTDLLSKPIPKVTELSRVASKFDSTGNPVYVDEMGDELVCLAPGTNVCTDIASDASFRSKLKYLSGDKVGSVAGVAALVEADGTTPVLAGRLAATAKAAMQDYRVLPTGQAQVFPGYSVRVDSWQLCVTPRRRFSLSAAPGVGILECQQY
jgi:hypothetical protein